MKSFTLSLILLGSLATTLPAQEAMSLPQAKMQELQALVGAWEGTGWVEFEGTPRREFTAIEEVESKLDGLVLTMELTGKGMLPELEELGEIVFHHSFGIATYDAVDNRYRMATFREDGTIRIVDVEVSNGGMEWSYDDPELGTVRNTVRLTESGMYYAAGSFRHEGGWRQFYKLELERKM